MNAGSRTRSYYSYVKKLPIIETVKDAEYENYKYELRFDEKENFFVIIEWEFYNDKWNIEDTISTYLENKHDLLLRWRKVYDGTYFEK